MDHQLKFIDIFVGLPGRMHDARVWRNSPIYGRLTNNENPLLPPNFHLIGDSAYPLMPNLMTPFRDNGHLNERQTNYNSKLSSIRSVVERAFARLKGKFRRLKDLDVCSPETGTNIIAAACVLHNVILSNEEENDIENIHENNMPEVEDDAHIQRENRPAAIMKRLDIMNNL